MAHDCLCLLVHEILGVRACPGGPFGVIITHIIPVEAFLQVVLLIKTLETQVTKHTVDVDLPLL